MQESLSSVSKNVWPDRIDCCKSPKDLFNCREFYILLERFCQMIVHKDKQIQKFLDKYFNDEGYIDIWRIPLLLTDIYNGEICLEKRIFRSDSSLKNLRRFVELFFNYCFNVYKNKQSGENLSVLNYIEHNDLTNIKTLNQEINVLIDIYNCTCKNIEKLILKNKLN